MPNVPNKLEDGMLVCDLCFWLAEDGQKVNLVKKGVCCLCGITSVDIGRSNKRIPLSNNDGMQFLLPTKTSLFEVLSR